MTVAEQFVRRGTGGSIRLRRYVNTRGGHIIVFRAYITKPGDNEEVARVLLAAVLMTLAGLATAGQRRLTLPEAERLALAALSDDTKRLPGFFLEPPPTAPKNGATFEVLWGANALGGVRAQSLVVDVDTAEVWDATTCQRLTTPGVKAIQAVVRRELKILATEVSRARAQARMTGCSSLIDPRPKRIDFRPAGLITVDFDKNGVSYRYTVTSGGCGYRISSPVPLDIRDGEVKFAIIANTMYVIENHGEIREVYYERGVCA